MIHFQEPKALFCVLIILMIAGYMWYMREKYFTPLLKCFFQKTHTMNNKSKFRLNVGLRFFNLGFACLMLGSIYCFLIIAHTGVINDTIITLLHISFKLGIITIIGLFIILFT